MRRRGWACRSWAVTARFYAPGLNSWTICRSSDRCLFHVLGEPAAVDRRSWDVYEVKCECRVIGTSRGSLCRESAKDDEQKEGFRLKREHRSMKGDELMLQQAVVQDMKKM